MGMDYSYAGSASYPRFDRELCEVAKVFGGIETDHLRKRRETEAERPMGYWFGFMSSDGSDEDKFIFPEGTNETLVKWFNNIYSYFNEKEVKVIWNLIKEHPEIENISRQIWMELEYLNKLDLGWEIH